MRISKASVAFFFLYSFIVLFVFRSLVFNITTSLPDWRDQALANWIINQNVDKIISLDFSHFYNTNAFYPHPYSLLFSDLYLPQTIIDLPLLRLTQSPIVSFNLLFLLTFILNYISSFIFWKFLFKNQGVAFIGALLFCFSPFFHLEMAHLQMLTLWPFMIALYFLFKNKETPKTKYVLLTGVFLAVQFLASVYLSIFLVATIVLFFLPESLLNKKILPSLKSLLIIFLIFLVLDGVFIKGYSDMKKYYGAQRRLEEYVAYSAQLSDYIFSKPINSLIHKSSFMNLWNGQDKNIGIMASFPGFTLFFLSLAGIFVLKLKQRKILLFVDLDSTRLFFFLLIILGLIFSLGPRLMFNGTYTSIVAPYAVFLRIIPFLEAARVPMRWSLLFYLGLIFFTLVAIKNIYEKVYLKKKIYVLTVALIVAIFLEYIPLNISSERREYVTNEYNILKDICSKHKEAILELPVTHLDVYPNIVEGVAYISGVEFSSTYHKCNLVNGYSGYDLPSIFSLRNKLNNDIINADSEAFISDLRDYKVDILKVNSQYFIKELRTPFVTMEQKIVRMPRVSRISESLFYITM